MSQSFPESHNIIQKKLGDYIYSFKNEPLELVIGKLLKRKKATLSIAESCTGGLISHRVTNVPGSSEYMERAVVVYSNKSKIELLGVSETTLKRYGAVSSQTAEEMVKGIQALSQSTYAISVTGIAGPTGGTPQKPVGTVFIGIIGPSHFTVTHYHFKGKRDQIKVITSQTALNNLRLLLLGKDISTA